MATLPSRRVCSSGFGGADRDRTDDLLSAISVFVSRYADTSGQQILLASGSVESMVARGGRTVLMNLALGRLYHAFSFCVPRSVVEELRLDSVLVGRSAGARVDPRVRCFDVEIVPVRVPRQTKLLTVVVVGLARRGFEALPLISHERHDFGRREVKAGLQRGILLLGNGGERFSSIKGVERQDSVEGVLHDRNGELRVGGIRLEVLLMIESAADGQDSLVPEIDFGIDVAGLGIPDVVLAAGRDPKSVASNATARRWCSCRGNAYALQ